jgi:hypothetical protein
VSALGCYTDLPAGPLPVSIGTSRSERRLVLVRFQTTLEEEVAMRTAWKIATLVTALLACPLAAAAGKVEGVGIGAGVGAVVAGPVGAVVGGVVGYKVGGPNIVSRRYRSCWHDERGRRHCRRR